MKPLKTFFILAILLLSVSTASATSGYTCNASACDQSTCVKCSNAEPNYISTCENYILTHFNDIDNQYLQKQKYAACKQCKTATKKGSKTCINCNTCNKVCRNCNTCNNTCKNCNPCNKACKNCNTCNKVCNTCNTCKEACRNCNTCNKTCRNCNTNTNSTVIDTNSTVIDTTPNTTTVNTTGITTEKLCRNNVCTVGGNGQTIVLTNYNNAKDPTYAQLIAFAKTDKTDEKPYSSTYVCSDYAKDFHDAAERAGIKAGWVGAYGCNHAFNIFNTVDRGTVYIDTTGLPGGSTQQDKILNVQIGQPLTGAYISTGEPVSMGCIIQRLLVYW